MTLFPDFIWTLLPTQESRCKERKRHRRWCLTPGVPEQNHCPELWSLRLLPSVIKLSTFSQTQNTTHSDHCFPLDLIFLPLLLSPFWSRKHDMDLHSTWGERRRSGCIQTLTTNTQGKSWCSWCLPWSSNWFSFSSSEKMVSWVLAILLCL